MGQFFRGEDADNEEIQRLAIEYLEDMISLLLKYRKNHRVVVEIVDAGVGSPLPAGFAKQIGWPHEAGRISEKLHAYCETELVLLIHEARATERLLEGWRRSRG